MKIRSYLVGIVAATLIACTTFQPHIGMTFAEWKHTAAKGFKGGPVLIGAKGNVEIYRLSGTSDNIFYYFEDGLLAKVDQGVEAQQRIQFEIINH